MKKVFPFDSDWTEIRTSPSHSLYSATFFWDYPVRVTKMFASSEKTKASYDDLYLNRISLPPIDKSFLLLDIGVGNRRTLVPYVPLYMISGQDLILSIVNTAEKFQLWFRASTPFYIRLIGSRV